MPNWHTYLTDAQQKFAIDTLRALGRLLPEGMGIVRETLLGQTGVEGKIDCTRDCQQYLFCTVVISWIPTAHDHLRWRIQGEEKSLSGFEKDANLLTPEGAAMRIYGDLTLFPDGPKKV